MRVPAAPVPQKKGNNSPNACLWSVPGGSVLKSVFYWVRTITGENKLEKAFPFPQLADTSRNDQHTKKTQKNVACHFATS
jgi:hypothetical protein